MGKAERGDVGDGCSNELGTVLGQVVDVRFTANQMASV